MNGDSTPASPEMRRGWKPRVAFLLAVAGILSVVAFLLKSPVPLFAALPLLLAPFVAVLEAPTGTGRAKVEWQSFGSGPEVVVRGTIDFERGTSGRSVRVEFHPAEPLTLLRPPEIRRSARQITFELNLRAPYPCLVWFALPRLTWVDPLEVLEVPVALDGEALRIDRFPPELSRIENAKLRRTTPSPGEVRARQIGRAGEFFSVRSAVPGDTARQINWWATARSGRLLANDYFLERTGDLVLVLDLRPSSLGRDRDGQLLSLARAAAAGIADAFLADKARVGVAIYSEFLEAIPLGSGRLQRFRIRQLLMRAQVAEDGGMAERLGVSMRRFFPPGVTTLLISPLADDGSQLLVTHLRRRGYPTIVLSPSPIPLLAPPPGTATEDDALTARILALVRRQRLAAAWREAPTVDWEDYWSLAPFVRLLSSPARAGRVS